MHRGLEDPIVTPAAIDMEWYNQNVSTDFAYVDAVLKKMNIYGLITIKQDFVPA